MAKRIRVLSAALIATYAALLLATTPAGATSWYPWYAPTSTGASITNGNVTTTVGPNYLLGTPNHTAHITQAGINQAPWTSPVGDYCGYYNVPTLNQGNPYSWKAFSGFDTPTPYAQYSAWDGAGSPFAWPGSTCQASANTWGYWIDWQDPGVQCELPHSCGMTHAVSLNQQNAFPWFEYWFGTNPGRALVLQANFDAANAWAGNTRLEGWAFLCAELQDTYGNGDTIEYCMDQWQPNTNYKPQALTCSGADPTTGKAFTGVTVPLGSNSSYVSTEPWSQSAITDGSTGNHTFAGYITTTNLQSAISDLNNTVMPQTPGCTSLPRLSTNPDNYQLVGISDGIEAWHGTYQIGGNASSLYVETAY